MSNNNVSKSLKSLFQSLMYPIAAFLAKRPLLAFILKRLASIIPIIIVMSFVSFTLFDIMPGDPLSEMRFNPAYDQDDIARYEIKYGLNEPFIVRYWKWFSNAVFRFDLGRSFTYKTDVTFLLASRLPATISLNLLGLIASLFLGFALGIISAVFNGRWPDRLITVLAVLLYALPYFVFAYLLQYMAIVTNLFPTSGAVSPGYEEFSFFGKLADELLHLALPVASTTLASLAITIRQMRNQELNELNQPYVLTLRAKGMKEGPIILKHALRNALNPFITNAGYLLSAMISGSLITEIVFSYPGVGRLTFDALNRRDVYVVMANFLMVGTLTLAGLTISDILLAITDPRIRIS